MAGGAPGIQDARKAVAQFLASLAPAGTGEQAATAIFLQAACSPWIGIRT